MPLNYPFERFALLCHQRSGSNALTSWATSHPQIRLYGQLFNNSPQYWRTNRRYGLPLFRAHPESSKHVGLNPPLRYRIADARVAMARRETDVGRFMERFWSKYGADDELRAVGFKLHDYQLEDHDMRTLLTDDIDSLIIQSRRNLLKAAVSWGYAVKTSVWVQNARNARKLKPVSLDLREVEWFVEKTQRNVAHWRSLAEETGVRTLDIEYETLFASGDFSVLEDFLNVDAATETGITTKKIAGKKYAHILNAEDINQRLGSSETGFLFS